MKRFCKHGHRYTESNTAWYINKKTGKSYYQCRQCHSIVEKTRYCLNEDYRQKVIKRAKQNYRKRRDASTSNAAYEKEASGGGLGLRLFSIR